MPAGRHSSGKVFIRITLNLYVYQQPFFPSFFSEYFYQFIHKLRCLHIFRRGKELLQFFIQELESFLHVEQLVGIWEEKAEKIVK